MQSITTNSIPTSKITHVFEQAQHKGHGVLIPYFMCGYPSAAQSIKLILAAIEGGADMIELGMPFSDPLADGATIQHAGHIALERGMTINGCLEIAQQISAQKSTIPLILMGYYNPIIAYGIEHFCEAAAASGVSGLIIPDLPPEEAAPLQKAAHQQGLSLIFLIPPTASHERIATIVQIAAAEPGSFIYCVALSGVTGARTTLPSHLEGFVQQVHGYTKKYGLPIVVGFGLSTPAHIAEVMRYAQGAIIASALVNLIDTHKEHEQAQAVKEFISSISTHR